MRGILANRSSDLIGGLIALAIGAYIVLEAFGFRMGTLRNMGPGYFPVLLGAVLALMGLLLIVLGSKEKPFGAGSMGTLRGMILLGSAFLAFALLIERAGLVPTAFITTFLASQSDVRMTLLSGAILALATATGAFVIFNMALGIQIEAFPS